MNDIKEWNNLDTDNLFKAILKLKTVSECEKFFRDLMTVQEIKTFAARWKTVLMLNKKEAYRIISKETGMSTTTVTRINNWLERGTGGYKLVLKRIHSK